MKFLKGFSVVAGVVGVFVLQHLVGSSINLVVVRALHYWAYPALFGLEMMLAGLVLIVLVPANKKSWFMIWLLAKFPRVGKWIMKFLTVDEARFSKGIWARALKMGPFALVLLVSVLIGAFFAALVIRFLALPERKALKYSFLTTFIAVAAKTSFYLGVVDSIGSFFASLFASLFMK